MIFHDLLIYCKLKAIDTMLNPSEESLWRSITRAYSTRFHVPLPQVRDMDPEEVIIEVLEARNEDVDEFDEIEGILEDILKIENPGYEKAQKADMDVFIKNMAKREQARLDAEDEKEERRTNKLRKQPDKPKPTKGSVDFGDLKED